MMSVTSARNAIAEIFADKSGASPQSIPDVRFTWKELDRVLRPQWSRYQYALDYTNVFGGRLAMFMYGDGGAIHSRTSVYNAFRIEWSNGVSTGPAVWLLSLDELEAFVTRVDRLAERAEALALRREKIRRFSENAFKAQFRKLAAPKWRWRVKWRAVDVKVEVYVCVTGYGEERSVDARSSIATKEQRKGAPRAIADELSQAIDTGTCAELRWYRTQSIPDPGPGWEGLYRRAPISEEDRRAPIPGRS
jgi:hypothetical protein